MNQGTDAVGDEGTIHVIPGAVGSVVLAVNFPDNCDRSLLPDSAETNPASRERGAVHRPRALHAHAGRGDLERGHRPRRVDGDLPDAGRPTRTATSSSRASSGSTTRARRSRSRTGSTRSTRRATGTRASRHGPDTRNWPNASRRARARTAPAPRSGPQGTHLTSGCANGNGPLMAKLQATDGGVGYSDIATARANGSAISPPRRASRDDDQFWTQTTNPSGTFVEPTADPNGSARTAEGRQLRATRVHRACRRRRSATGRRERHDSTRRPGSSAR